MSAPDEPWPEIRSPRPVETPVAKLNPALLGTKEERDAYADEMVARLNERERVEKAAAIAQSRDEAMPIPTRAAIRQIRTYLNEIEAAPLDKHEVLRCAFLIWAEAGAIIGTASETEQAALRAWQEHEAKTENREGGK